MNIAGMVLAAGRGTRLAQTGETRPKPLVEVGGQAMLLTALTRLRHAGAKPLLVNLHHCGDEIQSFLQAHAPDVICLPEEVLLDTGGAIRAALPHLPPYFFISTCDGLWGDEVMAAAKLQQMAAKFDPSQLDGMLLLASHKRSHGCDGGDFALRPNGLLTRTGRREQIYSGAGILAASLFAEQAAAIFPLAPLLFNSAAAGRLSGHLLADDFFHAGTAAGLQAAQDFFIGQ